MGSGVPASDAQGRGERSIRIQVSFAREDLRQIDDWRFQTRKENRAHAIRELVKIGLAACGSGEEDIEE